MALGPKEAELRRQREARSKGGGVAVLERPKRKAQNGGDRKPPNGPAEVTASGDGPFIPVTVSLDQPLIDKVDNWAHSKRLTRSAAARALLEKGLK